jgi:hypothetical protein
MASSAQESVEPAEQSVQDGILEMLESDVHIPDDVKGAVLNALPK